MGHGNEPPHPGEKGVAFDNTVIYIEPYMCIRSCSSIFHGPKAPSGPLHYPGVAIALRHIALGRTPLDK